MKLYYAIPNPRNEKYSRTEYFRYHKARDRWIAYTGHSFDTGVVESDSPTTKMYYVVQDLPNNGHPTHVPTLSTVKVYKTMEERADAQKQLSAGYGGWKLTFEIEVPDLYEDEFPLSYFKYV